MTKERPILFSAPMVRALLDGSKTQTRRIVKPQPIGEMCFESGPPDYKNVYAILNDEKRIPCPYGQPGDRLWVKEAHYSFGHWVRDGLTKAGKPKWKFVRDSKETLFQPPEGWLSHRAKSSPKIPAWYKRSSLFLPRWASRITLEITGVRVEQLQDIHHNKADLLAEGITLPPSELYQDINTSDKLERQYTKLWESINGTGSWDKNPWVWVIEFKGGRKQ